MASSSKAPTAPAQWTWLPAEVAVRLLRFDWPGNIRQLRNGARRLVIGGRGQAQLRLEAELAAQVAARSEEGRLSSLDAETPEREQRPRRRTSDVTEAELLAALREWGCPAFVDTADVMEDGVHGTK